MSTETPRHQPIVCSAAHPPARLGKRCQFGMGHIRMLRAEPHDLLRELALPGIVRAAPEAILFPYESIYVALIKAASRTQPATVQEPNPVYVPRDVARPPPRLRWIGLRGVSGELAGMMQD